MFIPDNAACDRTPAHCAREWFVKRQWAVCVHMKMRVRVGVGPGVRVVRPPQKGQVLDEMCSSGPGGSARLD